MDYVARYAEMCRAKNRPFALVDGQLFIRRERWIAPLGPAAQAFHLDEARRRELLRQLGGLWVMWTDGFESAAPDPEWYAVICRRHTPVDAVASDNMRKQIRRGLKRCEVRQVDAREIARHGHETYVAAVGEYGASSSSLPTAEEFARRVMADEPFADIRHHWAVYVEGRMVGFIQNLIYGKAEANYTHGKWHPQYLQHFPGYALFHRMNEYYLAQEKYACVNAGFRSIQHDSGIQDFLIRKFGFEKAGTGLHVHFRPPLGPVLRMAHPFGGAIARLFPKAKPLFELVRRSGAP